MKPDRTIMPDRLQQALWKARDYLAEQHSADIEYALFKTGTLSQLRHECMKELYDKIPKWWLFWRDDPERPMGVMVVSYAGRSRRRMLRLINRATVSLQVEIGAR